MGVNVVDDCARKGNIYVLMNGSLVDRMTLDVEPRRVYLHRALVDRAVNIIFI